MYIKLELCRPSCHASG